MLNEKNFREAFEPLHASDELAKEVLKMTQQNENRSPRWVLRTAMVAALVAMLATTVYAAPMIINAIFGEVTGVEEFFTPTSPSGESEIKTGYEITLEMNLNENAPEVIETFYMPDMPEEYIHSFGYAYAGYDFDNLGKVTYGWDTQTGEKMAVMLDQMSAEGFFHNRVISVHTQMAEGPQMEQTVLGGVEGFLVQTPDDWSWFIWSNGDYVFRLAVRAGITLDQMEQIVTSVQAVDDVTPYLISMTEDELDKTFGN